MTDSYFLITGSSMGIGKYIASELASRGKNVILVSLPEQNLPEIARDIANKYNVLTDFIELDLRENSGPKNVFDWVESKGYVIEGLVNNAGMAGTAIFDESDEKYIDDRILVNIRALVLLNRFFIPDMKKLPRAYILNISSLSAWYSIPFKSIYAASKTFVLNFSRALKSELKGHSIKVSVVCPNGVKTNEGTLARINSHGNKGKWVTVSVEKVARLSVEGMLRGKFLIIPGYFNHFLIFLRRFTPHFMEQNLLYREFFKEVEVSKNKSSHF